MKKLFLLFLSSIVFILLTTKSFAYLDPGTGSIILQAILFILAGIGTFFAFFKNKVKEIYNKLFKKNNNKKDNNEE